MLAGSLWRKALVTLLTIGAIVWLYEAQILDSLGVGRRLGVTEIDPSGAVAARPGVRLPFTATAYCKGHVTSAGVAPRRGVVAGDPKVLPLGSIVEIDAVDPRIDGVYSVLDTGPEIQGRRIDLYMWSCHDALKFGRQTVRLTVMRMGWNPRATTKSFMERLFEPVDEDPSPEPEPEPARQSRPEREPETEPARQSTPEPAPEPPLPSRPLTLP
ncbi:MAG: 3D domain-containing protein [Vicinamibacterales bacterium]